MQRDAIAGTSTPAAGAAGGVTIVGDVLIAASARVVGPCTLGPNVVVGEGCVVHGGGAAVSNATLLPRTSVGAGARISQAIVGWSNSIGEAARIEGVQGAPFVSGEDVCVRARLEVANIRICPHLTISANKLTPGEIVM